MKPIPVIWRIDVEPDNFEPGEGKPPWTGFGETSDFVERLRGPLEDRSGEPIVPTWFFRLDPDIEHWYGRADYVLVHHASQIDHLRAQGDLFGIHVHYYRWNKEQQVSYSEHADTDWTIHCLDVSAKTFERYFGEPPRRVCQGAFFISDAIVNRAIALGVEVDVTAEPGLPVLSAASSFGAYATAPSTDFSQYPRRPYYPSRSELRSPARSADDARAMLMVPLTSYDYNRAWGPWHKRFAKNILRWPYQHVPLNPWTEWPSPKEYWDLVTKAADEGPARYVALAIRTNGAGSVKQRLVQKLFDYLPRHPIARRLRFVDPLSPEIKSLVAPFN